MIRDTSLLNFQRSQIANPKFPGSCSSKDHQFRIGAAERLNGWVSWSERIGLRRGLDTIRDSRIASQAARDRRVDRGYGREVQLGPEIKKLEAMPGS
jgi:hypothetical protein